VECTRDELADKIGRDIATVADSAPLPTGALVLDPFTGSGNTLYWMLRHLPGAHGLGLEQDPMVFQLTSRNLAILNLLIEVSNLDYKTGLSALNQLLIAFIAPPWGYETLDPASEAELIPRFSWSAKRMYGLNTPGQNHGLFMGTRGWVP
jgi:hypothetical protein